MKATLLWASSIVAAALVVVMALSVGTHLTLDEASLVGAPIVLGALAVFVAWERIEKQPIAPR